MDGDAKINFAEFKVGLKSSQSEFKKRPRSETKVYNPVRAKSVTELKSSQSKATQNKK
jgi:hypothetical protein